MQKGKFIVVEGIDASGKTTQDKLLANLLTKREIPYISLDFPQYYTSFWGKMIGRYLRGKFGGLYQNNPYLST